MRTLVNTTRHMADIDSTIPLNLAASAWDAAATTAREMALVLRAFIDQHRALHGGRAPAAIFISADVFPWLHAESEPSLALKRTNSGYSFEGIAVEPRRGQTLPFMLQPHLPERAWIFQRLAWAKVPRKRKPGRHSEPGSQPTWDCFVTKASKPASIAAALCSDSPYAVSATSSTLDPSSSRNRPATSNPLWLGIEMSMYATVGRQLSAASAQSRPS